MTRERETDDGNHARRRWNHGHVAHMTMREDTVADQKREQINQTRDHLAFTLYCYYQYCMVYDIQKGGSRWGRVLPKSRAIVLQQCGQCKRAGRIQGRLILIRAQMTKVK